MPTEYTGKVNMKIDLAAEFKELSRNKAWPLRRGRTLVTPQTRSWSQERWDENQHYERGLIFSNFLDNLGKSRIQIAKIADSISDSDPVRDLIVNSPLRRAQLCLEVVRIAAAGLYPVCANDNLIHWEEGYTEEMVLKNFEINKDFYEDVKRRAYE